MQSLNRSIVSTFAIASLACISCYDVPTSDPTVEVSEIGNVAVEATSSQPDTNNADNQSSKKQPEGLEMNLETVTLGAGCFWCIEAVLDRIKGIQSVESGYMGGKNKNPTYEQVCTGTTDHAEVVQVTFDTNVLSLDALLDIFWQLHDPTTLNQQGFDVGTQYRSAIFFHSDEQQQVAEKSKQKWDESGKFDNPIVTEIAPTSTFYRAEEYHQQFFARNPSNPYCRANILPKLKKLGLLKVRD